MNRTMCDEADRRRMLARLAESRRGAVRVPRSRGPGGCCSTAGRVCSPGCERATAERLARGRRDRHHALPPRPLGRPRPVGLGNMWGLGRDTKRPSSGCRPAGARSSAAFGDALRDAGHVRARLRAAGVRRGGAVHGGGPRGDAAAASALHGADVRVPRLERRRGRSPIQATRARARSSPTLASDVDLFLCEATLERRRLGRRAARPSLGRRGDRGVRGLGRQEARSSRTAPRSSPLATASSRPKTASN